MRGGRSPEKVQDHAARTWVLVAEYAQNVAVLKGFEQACAKGAVFGHDAKAVGFFAVLNELVSVGIRHVSGDGDHRFEEGQALCGNLPAPKMGRDHDDALLGVVQQRHGVIRNDDIDGIAPIIFENLVFGFQGFDKHGAEMAK